MGVVDYLCKNFGGSNLNSNLKILNVVSQKYSIAGCNWKAWCTHLLSNLISEHLKYFSLLCFMCLTV